MRDGDFSAPVCDFTGIAVSTVALREPAHVERSARVVGSEVAARPAQFGAMEISVNHADLLRSNAEVTRTTASVAATSP